MTPISLLEALADVPDPRSRQGRRHSLQAILALTVLAMLRGCKGSCHISDFGRDHGIEQLGLERDIAAGFAFEAGARQIAAAFSP